MHFGEQQTSAITWSYLSERAYGIESYCPILYGIYVTNLHRAKPQVDIEAAEPVSQVLGS